MSHKNSAERLREKIKTKLGEKVCPVPRPALLRDLALLYTRLGFTAFGGPAAHIALMEDEIVRRRKWLTHEQFLDLLGMVNLIPGPNSTQMAIQIGYRLAGWSGLLIGGICFILPAALLTLLLAWFYVTYGAVPQFGAVLYGLKAVMVSVVFQAIWNLSRTAIKSIPLALLGAAATVASALALNLLLVLFIAGMIAVAVEKTTQLRSLPSRNLASLFPQASLVISPGAIAATASASLFSVFLFFLKIGVVLFGSGYVLLAFLRSDLVIKLHWLTDKQLFDAITVGQITPGPVFTTATFIGYLLGRVPGAVVATLGIFLPSFVFIAIVGRLASRLRRSPVFGAFLDGVNIGALALMIVVTWHLGRTAIVDITTSALAALGLFALVRFKINPTWLMVLGAVVGLVAGRG